MKNQEIKVSKEMINENRHHGHRVYGTLYGYCHSHDGCDTCNPKIRFLCKVKCKIEELQTKMIDKISE